MSDREEVSIPVKLVKVFPATDKINVYPGVSRKVINVGFKEVSHVSREL